MNSLLTGEVHNARTDIIDVKDCRFIVFLVLYVLFYTCKRSEDFLVTSGLKLLALIGSGHESSTGFFVS